MGHYLSVWANYYINLSFTLINYVTKMCYREIWHEGKKKIEQFRDCKNEKKIRSAKKQQNFRNGRRRHERNMLVDKEAMCLAHSRAMHERAPRIRDVDSREGRRCEGVERRERAVREGPERLLPSGNFCLKLEFLCGSLGLGMQIGRRRRKPWVGETRSPVERKKCGWVKKATYDIVSS